MRCKGSEIIEPSLKETLTNITYLWFRCNQPVSYSEFEKEVLIQARLVLGPRELLDSINEKFLKLSNKLSYRSAARYHVVTKAVNLLYESKKTTPIDEIALLLLGAAMQLKWCKKTYQEKSFKKQLRNHKEGAF